ncbi:hypothetical protein [Fodinicola feengrottensis]|uniref:hypothetical protein n=1 Tax=Fodinicola feengrottensis TaxID=435914 RepID=UPI0013D61D74|nr:hypothetical protein [Fodinicola feengrottensis]
MPPARSSSLDRVRAPGRLPPRPPTAASAKPSASPAGRIDIATRAGDPRPFSTAELFPNATETVSGRGYRLLASQPVQDCRQAAAGTAATMLGQLGCNQVVRGTWADSAGRYVITVGLANLPTTAAAQQVIAVLRDPAKGSFLPYPVAGTSAAGFDGHSPTVVGWQAQGHYLVFSVAALAGGQPATVSDPDLRQATADLRSLVGNALLHRAITG